MFSQAKMVPDLPDSANWPGYEEDSVEYLVP